MAIIDGARTATMTPATTTIAATLTEIITGVADATARVPDRLTMIDTTDPPAAAGDAMRMRGASGARVAAIVMVAVVARIALRESRPLRSRRKMSVTDGRFLCNNLRHV